MEESTLLSAKLAVNNLLYYALIQAGMPIISNLRLENQSDDLLEGLELKIDFEYDFIESYSGPIKSIETGGFLELSPRFTIHSKAVFELTEKVVDLMTVRVLKGEEVLFQDKVDISVLPPTLWSGVTLFPETLASFVMPNVPEISLISARAATILKEKTGNPSFDGYLPGDKNRVLAQLSAIYAAIYELNIVYSIVPASFSEIGQRVRTPQEVYQVKQGNCLEMSLLFASVCESVGLHPFITVIKGHAFAGAWLSDQLFDSSLVWDIAELRKRLATGINEIEIFEATYMNQGQNKTFEQAVRKAHGHLEDEMQYFFSIDTNRCHLLGIRPMPVRLIEEGQVKIIDYGLAKDAEDKALVKENIQDYFLDTSKKEAVTKSTIWMRNLLDLSKRNNLISFRPSVKNIQLFTSNLDTLEDALSKGDSFTLTEVTGNLRVARKSNHFVDIENEQDLITEISRADFKAKKIRTFMEDMDLQYVLKTMYRDTQKSIEENGASSLFLAMGFLKWFDPKDGLDKEGGPYFRMAPLILVPIELIRKNIRTYEIRLRDEDSQMNITLLEFLRQNFQLSITGLNPLPEDEAGVDIKLVFNSIRKAIMEQKGWDVIDAAFLGHFSFSQFVMWNDLKERFDQLTENAVVKGLVEGTYVNSDKATVDPGDLDKDYSAANIISPSEVDSSQLAAIVEASKGSSFVLHGPPGTGKSQTITNMIANSLYQGKTVLFVAEKMAALNVVYDRLAKMGLEDFSLEIHSNKTSKRVVLDKFDKALQLQKKSNFGTFDRKAKRLDQVRDYLKGESADLHRVRKEGYSLYQLISWRSQLNDNEKVFQFSSDELEKLTPELWDELDQKIRLLQRNMDNLETPYYQHPLRVFEAGDYTLEKRSQVEHLLKELIENLDELIQSSVSNDTLEELSVAFRRMKLMEGIGTAQALNRMTAETWSKLFEQESRDHLANLARTIEQYVQEEKVLLARYSQEITHLDIAGLRTEYAKASTSLLFKGNKVKQALAPLQAICLQPLSLEDAVLQAEFIKIFQYQENKRKIESEIQHLESYLNHHFSSLDKFNDIMSLATNLDQLSQSKLLLTQEAWREFYELLKKGPESKEWMSSLSRVLQLLAQVQAHVQLSSQIANNKELDLQELRELVVSWKANLNKWKNIALLNRTIQDIGALGMAEFKANLTSYLSTKDLKDINLEECFTANLLNSLIMNYINQTPTLQSFNSLTSQEMIAEFNQLIDELNQIGKEEIQDKLISQMPQHTDLSLDDQKKVAGITKVIRSKGRGTSIRKLFQDNGSIIRRLTPCLLMSPLSVAQYIDLDFPKFDLVIFDEASQIKTGVAVGAMSRAKNCIIVGDPNQMPPTSFFSNQKLDEENIHVEDLESLLEDCLAIRMPEKHLTCHYRSQSESLIAFSNSMYYGNKMLTFPSPQDSQSSVSYLNVSGVYDRGNTRTNRIEAQQIVNEILKRLADPSKTGETIGVVTFNVSQQELIDDLLQEALAKNPKLEKVAKAMPEPIFIKNLENVQGDERDVIYFSTTYGPDETGRFYQNFGPIAKKGGWRRLNVAVSRSRLKMILVTSLSHDQIKVTAGTSEGVLGVKRFLEYAQKGKVSLPVRKKLSQDNDDDLLHALKQDLADKGFDLDLNLGVSNLKLELVLKNPYREGEYLCALILDGKNSLQLATVRDKTRMLGKILDSKGWLTYNLWTLDYYENKEKVLDNLTSVFKRLIEEAKHREDEGPGDTTSEELIEFRATEVDQPIKVEDEDEEQSEKQDSPAQTDATKTNLDSVTVTKELPTESTFADLENQSPLIHEEKAKIVAASRFDSPKQVEPIEQEEVRKEAAIQFVSLDFYPEKLEKGSIFDYKLKDIRGIMEEIIAIEGPIIDDYLLKRSLEQFSELKMTNNVKALLTEAIGKVKSKKSKEGDHLVYWGERDHKSYSCVRSHDEIRRDLEVIPLRELANVILLVLGQVETNDGLATDILVKQVTAQFGYARSTAKMTSRIEEALQLLVKLKGAKWDKRKDKVFKL